MISTKIDRLILGFIAVTLLITGCASQPSYSNDTEQLAVAKEAFMQHEYVQAVYLFEPLAIRGHSQAQYALGYLYYYGLGVAQNTKLATKWLASAAAKGNKKALKALELITQQQTAPTPEKKP